MNTIRIPAVAACCLLFCIEAARAGVSPPQYFGPTPYLSIDDSPFEAPGIGVCYEDFEDGKFDIPGATGNASILPPTGNTDSVDGDDGAIDGFGLQGSSYFGSETITITFDEERNEGLPRNVGLVWTDGDLNTTLTFEAFDKDGESILEAPHGPFAHPDASNSGTTAEDRFYGASHPEGISKVVITMSSGGIEIDHIQLDRCFLCGDTNFDSQIRVTDALNTLRTAVGSDSCVACVCDTNGNGTVTTSDALAILRRSVGLNPEMSCDECGSIV